MNYDAIILELMSRIKNLEEDISALKSAFDSLTTSAQTDENSELSPSSHIKTTEEMIDKCYFYGKKAYENQDLNLWNLANDISGETGMNRNSAFMYICAVKCMLEGVVYKRAINIKATKKYFSNILSEFGTSGLTKAIRATKLHAEYRKTFNHPVDSIEKLCAEFQNNL